jgi:ADP-ribosyl-[dinitrogen reductase] hydrolase
MVVEAGMEEYQYSADEKRALRPWFDAAVPLPLGPRSTRDRVRGMLLGLAVGDALGNTSEGMSPAERRDIFGRQYGDRHGDLRDYLPNRREDDQAVGLPSDDTQLAFWTVESLLRKRCLDPVDLAHTFTRQDRIYGIGSTVTAFLMAYRFGGKRWFEAGRPSAGNGALMRIAPVILPHIRNMTAGLWRDTVAATALTHRDEAAVAASVGFVGLLAECLAVPVGTVPAAGWWAETFLKYARAVETGVQYGCRVANDRFRGSLCDRVEWSVLPAIASGISVAKAADAWFSGAYLLETLPCVLLILARHGGEPEDAVARAVNDTWDNDTTAAIVGAAIGALHGEDALPARWRRGLLGRTREEDDGRVQELLERAVEVFV